MALIAVSFSMSAGNAQGQATTYTWTAGSSGTWSAGSYAEWDNNATSPTTTPDWSSVGGLDNSIAAFLGTGTGGTASLGTEIFASGITFDNSGGGWTINPGTLNLGGNGLTVTGGGITTVGADVAIAYPQTWSADTGTTLQHNGVLSGSNTTLEISGGGTVFLNGTGNTFAGSLILTSGILSVPSDGAFGSGTINFNGGTLQFTGDTTTDSSVRFDPSFLDQNYRIDVITGKTVTFTSDFGGDNTHSPNSLTKLGLGTLILEGNNYYQGPTTINAGTLLVNGDSSGATGAVVVQGTLGGTGIVGGSVTVSSGGTIRGGTETTVGTLTLSSGLSTDSGATIAIRITNLGSVTSAAPGSGYSSLSPTAVHSLLNVSGTLDISTGTIIKIDGGGTTLVPGNSYSYLIASGDATGFLGITERSQFDISGFTNANLDDFAFSLTGDSNGLYLNIVPVPEPAAVLGIAVGALALGGLVRRRIRKPTA